MTEQLVDTTVIQVRSVLNFMYAMGYTLDETAKTGRFATKQHPANSTVSFATAVKLHNKDAGGWEYNSNTGMVTARDLTLRTEFNALGVRMAIASKLVSQAKIDVNRFGQVITKSVLVKPLNAEVALMVETE